MRPYEPGQMTHLAKALFAQERSIQRLDGWFLAREAAMDGEEAQDEETYAAQALRRIVERLPLSISEYAVFAGTQRDAFVSSYALINPNFEVETFTGYCDPTAVFDDIAPNDAFPAERIRALRGRSAQTAYVRELSAVYRQYATYTKEAVFFVEQVTGHVIPDFRYALAHGVEGMTAQIDGRLRSEADAQRRANLSAMRHALESAVMLAARYEDIARAQMEGADPERRERLKRMADALRHVPARGARDLYEALQSFILLWQATCLEQAPNPFAMSVGNADRIFEPYRRMGGTSREEAAEMFKCLLVFFNVGSRSWAISQNILIGGRDLSGEDLCNETTYALLDAYYDMNLPQPILSVKLHRNTPERLYRELGKFFFTAGMLTPSLFNDETILPLLRANGVEDADAPDYAVAGCQEMLIMGKDNGNTTNSWLNLAKMLELTLTGGLSNVTGDRLMELEAPKDAAMLLGQVRERFYQTLERAAREMAEAANGATRALSHLRTPFLSCFMGGIDSGYDMRDTDHQCTKYNASGCLIHGLSVVADSFIAIDHMLRERPQDAQRLLYALRTDYRQDAELLSFVKACPKFGNNVPEVDDEARNIALRVSRIVKDLRNNWGNGFRADWSSPSTHLLYGHWVGATPDGRRARDMLGYGVDPLCGEAYQGLGFRMLSAFKLPYDAFNGGYASHLGIDPKYFAAGSYEERGLLMYRRIIAPLFFNPENKNPAPFYLYVNVTTPEILRRVLENPQRYAPSGVYIMRIHGTFVNFLDLSPAIQQDIIRRLDMASTRM